MATRYGFAPAPGTNYSLGDEPTLAARLDRLARSLKIHLTGVSGWRSPGHSVAVGGFANDPHTRGQASDTQGAQSIPEATLERFGLTRPFAGAQEANHIQLLGSRPSNARIPGGRVQTLADYWVQAGGARNLAPIMAAIGMAESGGRVNATHKNSNGSTDYGWLQINSSHGFDPQRLTSDPLYTARAGVQIERQQGLGAWTTYASGAYRSFLGGARSAAPTYGGLRPGGEPDSSAAIGSEFASYIAESDSAGNAQDVGLFQIPGGLPFQIPSFDPGGVFKHTAESISNISDFLKWVAWIFHPRNILRAVEFIVGLSLLGLGIYTLVQVEKGEETTLAKLPRQAVSATPAGRVYREASGARAGRRAARQTSRRAQFNTSKSRAQTGERRRQNVKRNERQMDEKYGGVPF